MKWIHRIAPWLSLCLALLAVLLGWELWRQSGEHSHAASEASNQDRRLAALRRQYTLNQAKPSSPAPAPTEARTKVPEAAPAAKDPKVLEAAKEVAQLAALREKQLFRRNALNHYREGLDALQLPPQTLEQAKAIIVASWEARAAAASKVKSSEELMALGSRHEQEEAQQLTALLGAPAYEQLKASTHVSSLDWTIGTDMWDGGAPLDKDQLQALALAQLRTGAQRTHWVVAPTPSQIPDPQTQLSPQDTALLAATTSSLSPTQQEILRRSLIEENQYNAAMRSARAQQEKLWQAQKAGGQ